MEWSVIPGFGNYEINAFGVVRKVITSHHKNAGKPISYFVRKNGYSQIILAKNGLRKRFLVHRLVALVFIGEQPTELHEIAHIDGNPLNNHYKNLAWKTHKENELDKLRHGTVLRGEKVGNAKLTNQKVLEIKGRLISGEMQKVISKMYGVHVSTISLIARNKYWKHV